MSNEKQDSAVDAHAVSDWVGEMKLALLRLETTALYAPAVEGMDPEKAVAERWAIAREVWGRCPLPVDEEDGDA